ncbi:hypothetical protein [Mycoplasma feriruminatoris]|uniref:Uncharacterized protein n=1 Tax=Mycoplasma feriruminatoris TaxID=1179777 RepID=A0AAX3TEM0_9MOLU|nr:hypothetical protein [Mycoplasma feriruminatoris]WFQ92600.1 hypothetical protein MFERI14822_00388 [Mycoplasma feriruminatoris]
MKKVLSYFLIILVFFTSLFFINNKPNNQINLTYNTQFNNEDSQSSVKEFLWGGKALRYFLYKHSDAQTNKSFNQFTDNLLGNFEIVFKYKTKHGYRQNDYITDQQSEEFRHAILSSILVTSEYGSTSPEEFFAESFSRYVSANEKQKNLTWYLLEHFFTKTFYKLKQQNIGILPSNNIETNWKKIKNVIDSETDVPYKYELEPEGNLDSKYDKLTPSDLGYQELYYKDLIDTNHVHIKSGYIYGYNSPQYVYDTVNYIYNKIFSKQIANLDFLNTNRNVLSAKKFIYYYDDNKDIFSDYMKLNLYKPKNVVKQNESEPFFKNFDQLDEYWKQKSRFNFGNSSAILIKQNFENIWNAIPSPKTLYTDYFDLNALKTNTVHLFNILQKVTHNNLDKIFINLILTNDSRFRINNNVLDEKIKGITSTSFSKNTASASYSYVLVKADSFNKKENQEQYNRSWFASNNQFQTLNHEFGHVLDSFLALNHYQEQLNKTNFSSLNFWADRQQSNLYQGNIVVNKNRNWTLYAIFIIGVIGINLAILIMYIGYNKIFKPKNKKVIRIE